MEAPRQLQSGHWQARVTGPDGKRYACGVHTSKKDAREAQIKKLAELQAKARKGIKQAKRVSFEEYANLYMHGRRPGEAGGVARTSWRVYQSALRRSLVPAYGPKYVDAITTLDIRKWWLSKPPTQGRQSEFYLLRAILQQATEDGLIETNPARIKGAGADMSKPRPTFSMADVHKLYGATEDPQMRAILILLVGSGARIGEVLALDWSDVELTTGRLVIEKHWTPYGVTPGTKNRKSPRRVVTLPQWAMDDLMRHFQHKPGADDAPLFTSSKGSRLSHDVFRRQFAKLRVIAGLPDMHIHDLRHTALTAFAQMPETTLKDVMARAGHSSEKTSLRYIHATEERDAQLAQALPSPFGVIAS